MVNKKQTLSGSTRIVVLIVLCALLPTAVAAQEDIAGSLVISGGVPLRNAYAIDDGGASDVATESDTGGVRLGVDALYDFSPDSRFGMGAVYRRWAPAEDWTANAGGVAFLWTWPGEIGLYTQLQFNAGIGRISYGDSFEEDFLFAGTEVDYGIGAFFELELRLFYPVFELAPLGELGTVNLAPHLSVASGGVAGSTTTVTSGSTSTDLQNTYSALTVNLGVTAAIIR